MNTVSEKLMENPLNLFSMLYDKLSQIKWLKIIPIYYFTVSMGQVSGHGMAGFSAQVSQGCNQSVS